MEDFFSEYFKLTTDTEPPRIYHRWCALSGIAALLGRNFWLRHGNNRIYPNMYIFLVGNPASRKSTAIKNIRRLIQEIGYDTISADKTSKEKFLLDLQDGTVEDANGHDVLAGSITGRNLFGEGEDKPSEVYVVAADDFSDFIGSGNFDFISLLGNLWDYDGVYRSRVKNSKSVAIPNPTINILSGNTPTSFASAFPPEATGQGLLSRIILVHGEATGKKITWPSSLPEEEERVKIALSNIKGSVRGEAEVTDGGAKLLDAIYQAWEPLEDSRLLYYSNRRFTHLLKTCLLVSASRFSTTITEETILLSNTLLFNIESNMSKALGEFGKGKYSDAAQKIMEHLFAVTEPQTVQELWKVVSGDLDKFSDIQTVMTNLQSADKLILMTKTGSIRGFLPKPVKKNVREQFVDLSLLTPEERY